MYTNLQNKCYININILYNKYKFILINAYIFISNLAEIIYKK